MPTLMAANVKISHTHHIYYYIFCSIKSSKRNCRVVKMRNDAVCKQKSPGKVSILDVLLGESIKFNEHLKPDVHHYCNNTVPIIFFISYLFWSSS